MTPVWRQILQQHVGEKGQAQVARELGYSAPAVSQILSDKYNGSLENFKARVMAVYGQYGNVSCPELGQITPLKCLETWKRANAVGLKCGNPRTAKLHKTCKNCPVRS